MTNAVFAAAFLIAATWLPWWAGVAFGILYLAEGGSPFLAVLAGFIPDFIFGAPVAALHGFAFLLGALMTTLALVALYLRDAMFE